MLALLLALAWLAAGSYALASFFRYRTYIRSLPPTPRNRKAQRAQIAVAIFGVVAVVGGAWRLFQYFRGPG
jgi:hypothetical protein